MGSFSIWHWMVVLLVVLLLFGGGKVSSLMGDFAKGIKSFKKNMAEPDDASMEASADKPPAARSPAPPARPRPAPRRARPPPRTSPKNLSRCAGEVGTRSGEGEGDGSARRRASRCSVLLQCRQPDHSQRRFCRHATASPLQRALPRPVCSLRGEEDVLMGEFSIWHWLVVLLVVLLLFGGGK